ncbi:MAG: hypothetical protein ACO3MW_09565 [Rhodospirillales bacterium]
MPHLGVITGLASEADCLNAYAFDERPAVRIAGASAQRAREAAQALVSSGCDGLVSLGLSGALDPHQKPGDIVVPDTVLNDDGRRFITDKLWRDSLVAVLSASMTVSRGTLAGSNEPLLTVEQKIACRLSSGAEAVDMESHAIAEVADKHGIPFVALRVIADSHLLEIPAWTMKGIQENGQVHEGQIFIGFLIRPWLWHKLGILAVSNKKALKALRRAILIAGPRLQFPG